MSDVERSEVVKRLVKRFENTLQNSQRLRELMKSQVEQGDRYSFELNCLSMAKNLLDEVEEFPGALTEAVDSCWQNMGGTSAKANPSS